MQRTGVTDLPLHGGNAPWWLLKRMKGLARSVVDIVIDEYGHGELVRRVSDPYWFQALSCALAYDWHSSGTTTVVCGVLKSVLDPQEHGVGVAGGKGKGAKDTPNEISSLCDKFGLGGRSTDDVIRASKMCAKVDSVAVQDGYDIYHHCLFLGEKGEWSVVQQGMNTADRYARRYQWGDDIDSFVLEPHSGISGREEKDVLDMTSAASKNAQRTVTDIVKEDPTKVRKMFESLKKENQTGLERWMGGIESKMSMLKLPERVNWNAIKAAYEWVPDNFEDLLGVKGMGAKTVRGLALVSQLIYGDGPSWKDPVRYSFAYGGKDGVPFPVERKAMDESISFLKRAIEDSRAGNNERIKALKGLERYAGKVRNNI